MTRKMLPAMIGAILAGGMLPAHADVTLFGHMMMSILTARPVRLASRAVKTWVTA
jgi:hypothetical protein